MRTRTSFVVALAALVALACAAGDVRSTEPEKLPAPAARQVDFHKDILAILANSSRKCHAGGQRKGGFRSTRARRCWPAAMRAWRWLWVRAESRLIALVAGLEPETIMPAQGPRLTSEQIGLLRAWIDQGLAWEAGFSFKKTPTAPLEPRRVALPEAPAGSGLSNPIDRLLVKYLETASVPPLAAVDDRTFLRRASLDLIGLMPTPEEVDAFVAEPAADSPVLGKRARGVHALLDARPTMRFTGCRSGTMHCGTIIAAPGTSMAGDCKSPIGWRERWSRTCRTISSCGR